MPKVVRRVGIAIGSSVLAWLAAALVARWLFGSGNFLVWVISAIVGISAYLVLLWREGRGG